MERLGPRGQSGQRWRVTIYRDDSETPIVYESVNSAFMTAGNTVLTVTIWNCAAGEHYYVNWPRERVAWWKVERA